VVLARVVGTVVSTRKEPKMEGVPLLLIEKIDPQSMDGTGSYLVALDAVGAGVGEVVVYVTGSSSRMTEATTGRPVDATISAIVDLVEINNEFVYRKDG
jgi:microcompartment protein CcmK/EutM